jgi:regulator of protease activity HflC (stomatin/prohibitin superfamily)
MKTAQTIVLALAAILTLPASAEEIGISEGGEKAGRVHATAHMGGRQAAKRMAIERRVALLGCAVAGGAADAYRSSQRCTPMQKSLFSTLIFFLIVGSGAAIALALHHYGVAPIGLIAVGVMAVVVAAIVAAAIRVASAWDRAVVLRLGKFRALKGPGLFGIIPVLDTIPYWIDIRVITSSFKAEKTLTKDTVPVDVDAVLFWKVVDPERAALAVADYTSAINWAAQTALRDVIGKTMLADLLEGRDKISGELRQIIDARTEPWGVNVNSVEVRDVLIPAGLQDAMSMQAQAERERQARVILGDSERQVAEKFGEAAKTYEHDPIALHLRAMNMLYEGLKSNSTIVLVPSSALDTMQLGVSGIAALAKALGRQRTSASEEADVGDGTPH